MTFAAENLNVMAYANGFTLWSYVCGDELSDICSKNYFAAADDSLKSGDMILVSCKRASFSSGALLLINSVKPEIVDTTNLSVSAGGIKP